ncbi:MAG: PKD domain-containing protein, partial [Campylobacterota bacterium]|nr:PKD domain-containing protein [Campylobacterota bacterium]
MKAIVENQKYQASSSLGMRLITVFVVLALLFLTGCSGGGGGGGDDGGSGGSSPVVPKIEIVAKDINVTVLDPLTKLSFTITSTEDIETFQVKINNIDRTELATLVGDILEIQPTSTAMLPFDYVIVTLTLTDKEGYTYTQTYDFSVDFDISIASGFSAVPQIGYAPLEVTFSPKISAEESIQLYHWDFGDGTKNDSNTSRANLIGSPVKHTYAQAGDYTAVLTIYDSTYQPASSQLIVKVFNEPPVVTSINASPSNGDFPLNTSFSARATDKEGIQEFLWDFDGDGIVDFNDTKVDENTTYIPTSASSYYTYTYDRVGEYQAILTITDINGSSTVVTVPTISVSVGPVGTPTITAYAYPSSGSAPLETRIYTYGSYNKWEWDFDGDGLFDYSSTTSGSVEHNYTVAGKYFARLQVTNSSGLKSSDTIEITVDQDISLTRSVDTIEIKKAETVDINVSVAGLSETTLLIENSRYQPIVTLLEWQERSGILNVTWDGTDGEGVVVKEGDYYVVLLYKEDGETKRFDLREERNN